MSPTGGFAPETVLRQAIEQYPTCGAAPDLLRIRSTSDRAHDRVRELMAGMPGFARGLSPGRRATTDECSFASLQAAALAATLVDRLRGPQAHLDPQRFWRHAVTVGVLSRLTAEGATADEDAAFPAGFCYAIGRLLLDQLVPDGFAEVLRACRETGMEANAAQRAAIGVTEAELGSAVARRWRFPPWLVDAIAHPRTQDSVPARGRGTIASVFPARLTALALGFDTELEADVPPPRRLRWVIDPVLLRLEARGGPDWLATHVDEILAGTRPGDGGSETP